MPTHNRCRSVVRLLETLRAGGLAAEQFEVIVAVDGSTDDTVSVVALLSVPFTVRVVEQSPARGAASARNLGATSARGPLLLFLDDDIEPLPGCLAEHVRVHSAAAAAHGEDPDPLVLIGAPIPVRATAPDFHQLAIWGWWEQQFERLAQPGYRFRFDDVYTGVLSMPSSLFVAVGGFDSTLPFSCRDDFELGRRVLDHGARLAFSRAAGGLHHEARDRRRLIERKIAEGQADVALARLHPGLWPALRLSQHRSPGRTALGLVRYLALRGNGIIDVSARAAARTLDLFHALRMRWVWRSLNAAVMYYWYWRGAYAAGGGSTGLRMLADRCRATLATERTLTVDLSDGVVACAALVDRARPSALHLRYAGRLVGTIDTVAGAERLRGVHLGPLVAGSLAAPLLTAIAFAELSASD